MRTRYAIFLTWLTLCAATQGAEKEDADLTTLDLETLMKLEVKVSTVRKRSEDLHDIPIAVTVLPSCR